MSSGPSFYEGVMSAVDLVHERWQSRKHRLPETIHSRSSVPLTEVDAIETQETNFPDSDQEIHAEDVVLSMTKSNVRMAREQYPRRED